MVKSTQSGTAGLFNLLRYDFNIVISHTHTHTQTHVVSSPPPWTGSAKVSQVKAVSTAPKALIIEPSKELAEQTLNVVNQFKKNVDNPKLRYTATVCVCVCPCVCVSMCVCPYVIEPPHNHMWDVIAEIS